MPGASLISRSPPHVYNVLETPAPTVRFLEFGENGLDFELRAWTTTLVHRRGKFTTEINFAIYDKLKEHEIEVPYPQRDITFAAERSISGAKPRALIKSICSSRSKRHKERSTAMVQQQKKRSFP